MPSVHQHHQQSTPPNRMIPNNASYSANMPNSNNTSPLINPNSAAAQMMSSASRFPFNSMMGSSSKPSESPNAASYDGSQSELRTGGFNIDSGKKKRGRPRKYSPDGNIALGLSPTPITSSAVPADSAGMHSPDPRPKKNRGRPPGTGKKQMDALGTYLYAFLPFFLFCFLYALSNGVVPVGRDRRCWFYSSCHSCETRRGKEICFLSCILCCC